VAATESGTWTVTGAGGTFPVSGTFWQATQPVSGTFWQATQPVSGTLTCNAGTGTLAVSGPATDTQLRATPLPVSGTVTANAGTGTMAVSGPLTDTQLRATAVPVSGTVTANAAQSGTWTVQPGNTANTTPWLTSTVLTTGAATIGALTANQSVNMAQVAGTTTATGAGASSAGTIRVMLSSDSALAANQSDNVAQVAGVAPVMTAASTPAAATDRGLVVSPSPNGGNPCQNPSATLASVAGATSGTAAVQLVGLSGSTKIYICSVNITGISGTTPTFSLKYGTGTACATGGVTILGAWTTAANTVYTFTQPFVTPAGQELCYLDTGTTPVQNYAITYVQQ